MRLREMHWGTCPRRQHKGRQAGDQAGFDRTLHAGEIFAIGKWSAPARFGNRALAYAEALGCGNHRARSNAGASFIQVDEPAIVKYPGDWAVFERALAPLVKAKEKAAVEGRKVDLALYVYFHDCTAIYEKLVALAGRRAGNRFYVQSKINRESSRGRLAEAARAWA